MYKIYKPAIYTKDVLSINYKKLKDQGIRGIIFDIDNTIVKCKDKYPNEKIKKLIKELKNNQFEVFIITNALKQRALRIGNELNTKTYYLSMKPSSKNYQKLMLENNLKSSELVAIGDQIYTDIKGANKLNIKSILVDPLSKNESIITKINRLKENNLIKKHKIIERGSYYE